MNFLLTLSRILFFISDILIIMRQYEYHVRFALSVAQLLFSFIIATILIFPMIMMYLCDLDIPNEEIQTHADPPIGQLTSDVTSSKSKTFTDFRPRKPSNQLAKLHYNSNRPTWMKWKRIMGSDSYNPTNI
jgi:hypothetical protein